MLQWYFTGPEQFKDPVWQKGQMNQPILPVIKPGENVPVHFFSQLSGREMLEISAYLDQWLLLWRTASYSTMLSAKQCCT